MRLFEILLLLRTAEELDVEQKLEPETSRLLDLA
jgi:hypothetical protein